MKIRANKAWLILLCSSRKPITPALIRSVTIILLFLFLLLSICFADMNIVTNSLTMSTVFVRIIVRRFFLAITTSKTFTATASASTKATMITEATIISPTVTIQTIAIIIAIVIVKMGRECTSCI